MSARDVDLEFEKAYQRLFKTSSATEAGASATASKAVLESSKAQHRADSISRLGAAGPSKPRLADRGHTSRHDEGLQKLSRHASDSKAHWSARTTKNVQPHQTQRLPRSTSSHSGLDALARHGASASSKGKERAHSHLNPGTHAGRISRSPTVPPAVQQYANVAPQEGAVAYYPIAHGQTPYPLVGPSIPSLPGQAVTWTQPIMPLGYPGFSAQVTFSQPQFFASHPQQLQPAITPLPPASFEQYEAQRRQAPAVSAAQTPTHDRQRASKSAQDLREGSRTYKSASRSAEVAAPRRQQFSSSNPTMGPPHSPVRKAAPLSPTKKAMLSPKAQAQLYLQSVMRRKYDARPKQKQWKPLLDENGVRIPRKRGRPRLRALSPTDDVPSTNAVKQEEIVRVKAEPGETQASKPPPQVLVTRTNPAVEADFDGCIPLRDDAGPPKDLETQTLFICPSRRLRWIARSAIAKVEQRIDPTASTGLPSWARWSKSIAARLQSLQPSSSPDPATASPNQSQSQTDPAGLFPRQRRQEYLALRKTLHTAARTATSRMCVRRLIRFLAKIAASAECIDLPRDRRKFLERKHRASKLAKHMLSSRRPTALDVRRLWSVWARAAHANSKQQEREQGKRVSFASPAELRVKQEPESPSKQRNLLQPQRPEGIMGVKAEPESDGVVTPPLPSTPVMGKVKLEREAAETAVRERAPLFLRRNFRLYRLLGLSDLPLS